MQDEELLARIAELERQLRVAKEEQQVSFEKAETLRQMFMEVNDELFDLLSNSNIGAMCLDLEMRIESVTPGIQEHFHIRRDDIGRPLTDLASNLIYEDLAPDIKEVIASANLKEVVIPSKDGRWFNMRISPHLDADGKIVGVVISLTDITHLKTREEEIKDRSENVLTAIKRSPIVVWNQDTHLRYTWVINSHAGFNPADVIGKTDMELLPHHEAEHLTEIKQRVLDTGVGAREKVTTTIQGVTYYYDLVVEALTDENSNVVGISCASLEMSKEEYHLLKTKQQIFDSPTINE